MIFADLELARRLEAAEARTGIACAEAQGGSVEEAAGGWAIFVGAESMLTHAVGLGMAGPVGAGELARVENFFRCRGAAVNLDLCPLAHPSLLDLVRRRGYRVVEFNNVLVKNLAGEPPAVPDERVGEAAPEDEQLWARTVGAGFFERPQLSPEELEVGRVLFRAAGMRCFLGRTAQGEAAAGGAMAIRQGLASFFGDGTVPEFRRSGLHVALIRARLNAALAEGCDLAAASTLPGSVSQRNFERLGFQVVYTKLGLVAE